MDGFVALLPWVLVAGAVVLFVPWGKVRLPFMSQPQVENGQDSRPVPADTGAESRKHFLALMECYLRAGDKGKAAALSAIETSPIGDKV